MRVLVFLCVLGVAVAQDSRYSWNGPSDPIVDPNTENVCLTDPSSCGCCLMQKQMSRMEQFFNMSLTELERGLVKTQNVLNNMRASRSAFSVALTNTRQCVGPFRDTVPLVYSHIFINLGSGYNAITGVFTVPRSGVYSLALTAYSDAGAPGATLADCVSLTVNGVQVAGLSETNMQDQEDSATVVLAIQLRAGDRVVVMLPVGCFLCDNESHYNTFTGFLLYATD